MKKYLPLLLGILVLGCSKSSDENLVSAPEITLNKDVLTLEKGKTERLIASFTPSDTPNKSHTWSSSAASIATVDETGSVTAIDPGDATITVTALDGKKTATCKVTVVNKTVRVTDISLDQTEVTIAEGKSTKLTATIKPDNATDKKIIWSSSDNGVATVDGLGTVSAVTKGNAVVTAKANESEKTVSCNIKVTKSGVTVSKPAISSIAKSSALITGTFEVVDVTVEEAGLCYSTSDSPTISDNKVVLSGNEVAYTLTNLTQLTKYYVRLYAKVDGVLSYGEQESFVTLSAVRTKFQPIEFFDRETTAEISFTSAASAGERFVSVCYGTSPNPKITHNKATASIGEDGKLHLELSNLEKGRTYYLRSYKEVGSKIEYFDDEVSAQTMGGDEFKVTCTFVKHSIVNGGGTSDIYGLFKFDYNIKNAGVYKVKTLEEFYGGLTVFTKNASGGPYDSSIYIENGKGVFYELTYGSHPLTSFADHLVTFRITNTETNVSYCFRVGKRVNINWSHL